MENLILCIGDEEEEDPLHIFSIRQFSVHEKMNACFEVRLVCASTFEDLALDDVVGQPATFSLNNSVGIWRGYSGIVARVEQLRVEATGKTLYEVRLLPDVWRLSLRKNYRIFQHMTVREIIDQILGEYDITEQEWYLDRQDYPKHEYRLQYDESDLEFISRLCEESGISWYFWDDAGDEEVESHLQFDDTPESSDLRFGDPIKYTDNPNESQGGGEFVSEVTLMHDVRPGAVVMRDFDFRRRIDAPVLGVAEPEPPEDMYEQYTYDPNFSLFDTDKADAGTPVADDHSKARHSDSEATILADVRIDALRVGKRHLTYRSSCHDLSPGMCFQMLHPRDDLDEVVLLAVECHIHGKHDGEWVLRGHAVFTDDWYRPRLRTKKPKVHGLQSAIVVGPKGQEIYADEFGRVRVRFHWDREGDFDDNRTCWLRVSQDWAGPMYGGIRLPRIDQEVLVDFFEGDPDNPIIVGRLFNATNRTPYALPSRKTVSTYKSDTSPHDGGFNEILFDDVAHSEYVYIQAEKDLWKLVKHDETEETGVDRQTQIGNTQQTFIGKDDTTTAGVSHDVAVGKTRVQKFDKFIVATVGDATITLDGANVTIVSKSDIQFKAEGTLSIEGGPYVHVNCNEPCAALWDQYRKEAEMVIAPAGENVIERNKIITGAYADLFLKNQKFAWAGLAAYASKQVGCGMEHAEKMSGLGRAAGGLPLVGQLTEGSADYTLAMLGKGNKDLFLDIYPMHRLYADHPEKFAECAGTLPEWAQNGFQAITDGDSHTSLVEIAKHEQINILQKEIYNDTAFKGILLANQLPLHANVPGLGQVGTSPAALTLSAGCEADSGPTTAFQGTKLYDVDQRMDWITNQAAPIYEGMAGSQQHVDDLNTLRDKGNKAGGQYPATGVDGL